MKNYIGLSALTVACVLGASNLANAASLDTKEAHKTANAVSLDPNHPNSFRNFAPELEVSLKRVPPINPETGLYVEEIEPGLHFVTDGIYQSAFLVTDAGVIVFDAPPSFGDRLRAAIQKAAPDQPITHLIYSHGHTDHVGGAVTFGDIEGLEIIASTKMSNNLKLRAHPDILLPTATFSGETSISYGGAQIRLTTSHFHAEDEDTIIYLPEQRFVMAVDTITPGEAPFMNFGATADVGAYLASFETFLSYDFEHFLSGHVSVLGTRDDVVAARDYAFDVRDAVLAGLGGFNEHFGQGFAAMEYRNANLGYRYAIEQIRDNCAQQVIDDWQGKLSVVDVWADSHCEETLLYYIMH